MRFKDNSFVADNGNRYPIVNNIPRFVQSDNYAASFGVQWLKYRQTQLDSFSGFPITHDRLKRCLGDELWNSLDDKLVLEAGCGAGRFTEVLLERGANLVSIDLSSAVEANIANFPASNKHMVSQAHIMHLPFTPQQFDVVICLGVVQHTPDPEATIKALYAQLKPGGWLIIDHCRLCLSQFTKLPWFIMRPIFKRLPAEKSIAVTKTIVNWFLPLHRMAGRCKIAQRLVFMISPIVAYYHSYPQLNDQQQREWASLDTHDCLTDWYKHLRTKDQIRNVLLKLGGVNIYCEKGGNGVEARARKPLR